MRARWPPAGRRGICRAMRGDGRLPPKKDVTELLLAGPSVFVHLDPRRQGVIVPKEFTMQPQLVLQIGLHMAIPIPDLEVDERGISCTLSFGRRGTWCHLPWSSIYAMRGEDGRGMMWPDDVPPEVAAQMRPRPAPALVAVPSPGAEPARPAAQPAPAAEPQPPAPEPARPAARSKATKKKPALSAVPEPGAAEPPKRSRSKAEKPRKGPTLVALDGAKAPAKPAPAKPAPAKPAAELAPTKDREPTSDAELTEASPPPPPAKPGKRPLPSYLRVVK